VRRSEADKSEAEWGGRAWGGRAWGSGVVKDGNGKQGRSGERVQHVVLALACTLAEAQRVGGRVLA
jgi:hypothetical protein